MLDIVSDFNRVIIVGRINLSVVEKSKFSQRHQKDEMPVIIDRCLRLLLCSRLNKSALNFDPPSRLTVLELVELWDM